MAFHIHILLTKPFVVENFFFQFLSNVNININKNMLKAFINNIRKVTCLVHMDTLIDRYMSW